MASGGIKIIYRLKSRTMMPKNYIRKTSSFFVLILFWFLICTFTSEFAHGQDWVEQTFPSKPGDTFVGLKNGLTILVRTDSKIPVVAIKIAVRTGSIYEPPMSGLSHYLEHVVAGGSTTRFSEEEARERLERLGGASNASTSYSTTEYYITTVPHQWRDAVDLLLGYVHDCVFDPEEVAREKGVILRELNMGENDPSRQLWYLFFKTAYRIHPVQYPVIGSSDIFEKQTRDDLVEYYRTWYVPSRMSIVVVGPVKGSEIVQYIAKETSTWENTVVKEPVFPEEPLTVSPRKSTKILPFVRQPRTMIGFPSVTLYNPDMYALDVLSTVLGEGNVSRLVQTIKEEMKLVTDITAFNWTPSFVRGQFIISSEDVPEKEGDVVQNAIRTVIEEIKLKGVTQEELERAKKRIIASFSFERDSAFSQASSLLRSFMETGDPYFEESYIEHIKKVTAKDIQYAAKEYIKWDRMTATRIEPPSRGENNVSMKETKEHKKPSLSPERVNLDNGLKVLIKPDESLPVVYLQLYGLGGQIMEPPDEPGISHFTSSLLTAGTKKFSKDELFQKIESLGGEVNAGSGRNTYFVSIRLLKDDLDTGLTLLRDILISSVFPPKEIEKQRNETLISIKRQQENWQRELILAFHQHFFRDHPYRYSVLGTAEAVRSFTRDDIVHFYRHMVVPNRAVLAVYGDVDPERVKERVVDIFDKWPSTNEKDVISLPFSELKPSKEGEIISISNEKSASGIFVGTAGLDVHSSLRSALDIMDAHLSGIQYPGGRLHEALRGGNRNYAYVVHAFPFYGFKAGYFGVITQTAPENVSRVLSIILDELKHAMEKPLSTEDLTKAKNTVLTMRTMSLERLESQAQDEAVNEVLGLGWDYETRYRQALERVSPEDVQNVARRLFPHFLIIQTFPRENHHAERVE